MIENNKGWWTSARVAVVENFKALRLRAKEPNPVGTAFGGFIILFGVGMPIAHYFRDELTCWPGFDCGSFGEWFGGIVTAFAVWIGWVQYVYNENRSMEIKEIELKERRASISIMLFADICSLYGSFRLKLRDLPGFTSQGALHQWFMTFNCAELAHLNAARSEIMELDPQLSKQMVDCLVQLRNSVAGIELQQKVLNGYVKAGLGLRADICADAHSQAEGLLVAGMYHAALTAFFLAAKYPSFKSEQLDFARAELADIEKRFWLR